MGINFNLFKQKENILNLDEGMEINKKTPAKTSQKKRNIQTKVDKEDIGLFGIHKRFDFEYLILFLSLS